MHRAATARCASTSSAARRELEVADRVSFIGELDDVRPVLTALDVFVLPSTAVESFSNAALEAMAIGRPVILSDIGGAREMIDDGVEGYVVVATELRGAAARR